MESLNPFRAEQRNLDSHSRNSAMQGLPAAGSVVSRFSFGGPEPEGKPDDKREVMLTYDVEAKSAQLRVQLAAGIVRRRVKAVPYDIMFRRRDTERVLSTAQVKPPLVHMDPTDPDADARWAAISAELCSPGSASVYSLICKPGMLEKLKAVDLGSAG